jgi:non-specific serine/threonine protein kinase
MLAHNLPVERTPPIGRRMETAAVCAMLRDPGVALVTLTGPGGMGKTTLALHVARELLHDFPDGVHFVDLTPLSDPALIPVQIVQVVGLNEDPGQGAGELLVDYYRHRHALLVLDNYEHLLDGSAVVSMLLKAAPRLKVLATSREALRLKDERLFPLPPLAMPGRNTADVGVLSHIAAVDLFVRRARAVQPDFDLTADNAAAVAGIAVSLDGLPLALELAAARVRHFPPAALLARLEASPLGVLAGGPRDMPARQQTIRSTVAWSHDLLEPAEARLFRRLGVFAGGFAAAAAAAVGSAAFGDPIDVPAGLESLLDKSLIQRLPAEDEPRFGLLEVLRAFALEHLEAVGEASAAHRAHFDHYLALAEAAAPHWRGPEAAAWIARLAADEDNLRAALAWSMDEPPVDPTTPHPGVLLAGALGDFWMFGNRHQEGRAWLERALALCSAGAPLPEGEVPERDRARLAAAARVQSAAGTMAWLRGAFEESRTLHEEALAGYRHIGDLAQAADSRHNLSVQLLSLGQLAPALEILLENLAYYREREDWRGMTRTLLSLGVYYIAIGDVETSRRYYGEAVTASRRAGYMLGLAMSLGNLGQVELRLGNLERAEQLFEEAREMAISLNYGQLEIDLMLAFGRLRERQGDLAEATRQVREALGRADALNYRLFVADALEHAGFALHGLGRTDRGALLLGAAAALRERLGAPDQRDQHAYYDQRLPLVRATLGEGAFTTAWEAGRAMPREQAVALALKELAAVERPPAVAPASADSLAGLTPREREVALLMARGRTNEQIAAELFISLKTVEKHAGNALGKLGFRNRVELAAWASSKGLLG